MAPGRPQERAIRSSNLSSCLAALMLSPLPPVNHVIHQLLSSFSPLFNFSPLPGSPCLPLDRLAFAFASLCSRNLLGAPSGRSGSGKGPNATFRGVERPDDGALGTTDIGLRISAKLDRDEFVWIDGGLFLRDDCRGGVLARVDVE